MMVIPSVRGALLNEIAGGCIAAASGARSQPARIGWPYTAAVVADTRCWPGGGLPINASANSMAQSDKLAERRDPCAHVTLAAGLGAA